MAPSRAGAGPKACRLCQQHAEPLDYKDTARLNQFVTDRSRIRSRHTTGNCARHQREVTMAIKLARELALLPSARRLAIQPGRAGRGPNQVRVEA